MRSCSLAWVSTVVICFSACGGTSHDAGGGLSVEFGPVRGVPRLSRGAYALRRPPSAGKAVGRRWSVAAMAWGRTARHRGGVALASRRGSKTAPTRSDRPRISEKKTSHDLLSRRRHRRDTHEDERTPLTNLLRLRLREFRRALHGVALLGLRVDGLAEPI